MRESIIPILRHPGRSALLVLTFALGFASVIASVATIEGGRQTIRSDAMALGIDVIAALNPVTVGPVTLIGESRAGTRPVDVAAIADLEREFGGAVAGVIPFRMELVLLRSGEKSVPTTAMATTPRFEGVLRAGLLAGRFLDAGDRIPDAPELPMPGVLDEALARELRPEDPAALVGEVISIFRAGKLGSVRVLGVFRDPISLRKHLKAFDGQSQARKITARRLEFKNVYLPWRPEVDAPSGVLVQLSDPDDADSILPRLESFFSARQMEPYFHVQRRWVEFVIDIVDRFSSLSHFIWIVDLLFVVVLTGTISIMSVEERYPEVALRRAEGATRAQVVLPLLGEATLLAVMSVPIGYGIGRMILEFGIRPVLDWPPYLPPLAVWGTPAAMVIAAWLAHLIPAQRIARLDPAAVLSDHRE